MFDFQRTTLVDRPSADGPDETGQADNKAERKAFDICGQLCPSTLLVVLKEVNERQDALRNGSLSLTFKTDNRDAIATIPDAVGHMGYDVKVTKHVGNYLIEIRALDRQAG